MSAKKMDKSAHEPGWGEVILGAALSVVLGAMIGAVALVLRPAMHVKEMPKEPAKGVIYFLEGSRDTAKAKQAAAKRKMFAQGGSIVATEDEINSFSQPLPVVAAPAAAKPGEKPKTPDKAPTPPPAKAGAPAAPASDELLAVGAPNVRIRDGVLQIVVPVTINVLGVGQQVMLVSTGTFVKKDGGFVFDPATVMLGSCPLQRVPFASGFVARKILTAKLVPDDIAAAWAKVTDVTVDGNTLKLTI